MTSAFFAAETDRTLLRSAGGSRRHVLFRLTAPSSQGKQRLPVNLGLVLDRSGSMAGEKLRLAKQAALAAIRTLKPIDRFTIVCYDDRADLVVPLTVATPQAVYAAAAAIDAIEVRGQTNLHAGWLRGCEQVQAALPADGVGRVILATDGQANRGVTDQQALIALAAQWRQRRVVTSTIGIGQDFAEQLLGQLADSGGGNFYYVEKDAALPAAIANEVGEILEVVAREAEVVLTIDQTMSPALSIEPLNPFVLHGSGPRWTLALGDLISAQQLGVVLAVRFPAGVAAQRCTLSLELRDRDGSLGGPRAQVQWSWASHADNAAQPRAALVDREVGKLYAARARRDASTLNRQGQYAQAEQLLGRVAAKIKGYAGRDPELLALIAELTREAEEASEPLEKVRLKAMYTRGHAYLKGKDDYGSSVRSSVAPGSGPRRPRLLIIPTTLRLRTTISQAIATMSGALVDQHLGLVLGDHLPAIHSAGPAGSVLSATTEAQLVDSLPSLPNGDVQFMFTEMALHDNWFSHWHEGKRTVVVSTAGCSQLATPLSAFIVYQLLLHGFRALAPSYDPRPLLHEETRGCIFDFCRIRKDIESKLRRAEVCAQCLPALERSAVPMDAFFVFCAQIRSLSQAAS